MQITANAIRLERAEAGPPDGVPLALIRGLGSQMIHGKDDMPIPPKAGEEIAALVPGAECEIAPGPGHTITPVLMPLIFRGVDACVRART